MRRLETKRGRSRRRSGRRAVGDPSSGPSTAQPAKSPRLTETAKIYKPTRPEPTTKSGVHVIRPPDTGEAGCPLDTPLTPDRPTDTATAVSRFSAFSLVKPARPTAIPGGRAWSHATDAMFHWAHFAHRRTGRVEESTFGHGSDANLESGRCVPRARKRSDLGVYGGVMPRVVA